MISFKERNHLWDKFSRFSDKFAKLNPREKSSENQFAKINPRKFILFFLIFHLSELTLSFVSQYQTTYEPLVEQLSKRLKIKKMNEKNQNV